MIQVASGNLLAAPVQALVNPVNCVGAVIGKGAALAMRRAFPEMMAPYIAACEAGEIQPGRIWPWQPPSGGPQILCLPTKRNWRDPALLEDVRSGLDALVAIVLVRGITSLAMPGVGCEPGELAWGDVRPLVERACASMPDVDVWLFAPAEHVDAATAPTPQASATV